MAGHASMSGLTPSERSGMTADEVSAAESAHAATLGARHAHPHPQRPPRLPTPSHGTRLGHTHPPAPLGPASPPPHVPRMAHYDLTSACHGRSRFDERPHTLGAQRHDGGRGVGSRIRTRRDSWCAPRPPTPAAPATSARALARHAPQPPTHPHTACLSTQALLVTLLPSRSRTKAICAEVQPETRLPALQRRLGRTATARSARRGKALPLRRSRLPNV